jgi:hypothetical protein
MPASPATRFKLGLKDRPGLPIVKQAAMRQPERKKERR